MTQFLDGAMPDVLAEERVDPWGGGDWRPTAGDCIRVILEEEWAHLRYIRRDLARLHRERRKERASKNDRSSPRAARGCSPGAGR